MTEFVKWGRNEESMIIFMTVFEHKSSHFPNPTLATWNVAAIQKKGKEV